MLSNSGIDFFSFLAVAVISLFVLLAIFTGSTK